MRAARKGVTLVELMVALVVLGVGIIMLINSFGYVQKAIQGSKNRTLASNLMQEKMQILKQLPYYQVLVTTDPAHDTTDFAPESVNYDTGYFPPETVIEAGVTYTRYTYIQVAREDSGKLVQLSPSTPDTGLKLITVTVVWGTGGSKRKLSLLSVVANPDTVMSNSTFNGAVTDSANNAPVYGALVNVAENMGWRDSTDASGDYSIGLSLGNYTMVVSAPGYYTQFRSVSIAANQAQEQDFSLVKIATGSVSGTVWLRDHLVISQVVGSTVSAGYDQEYVEVYNPTTFTWLMNGAVGLKFQRPVDAFAKTIAIDYDTDYLSSGGYYLFANAGTITAGGVSVNADAVWNGGNSTSDFPYFGTQKNIIPTSNESSEGGGALELYKVQDGTALDRVGWNRNSGGQTAPFSETAGIDQNIGLEVGEQYVRYASTAGLSSVWGPAYDSNNNNNDFYDAATIAYPPHNSLSSAISISGTPAAGSVVTASDGVSSSTTAWLTGGSRPYATFTLVDVATGTWMVIMSSGMYSLENDTVPIPSYGAVYVFPSSSTYLSQITGNAVITGHVTNVLGQPITAPSLIKVASNGAGPDAYASAASGRYTLLVSTGLIDITANPGNANSNYVSVSSVSIPVGLGQVYSGVDFTLYQGARISGFVTRDGINPLPGVVVSVMDSNGNSMDQQVSDVNGRFTSLNISTGVYGVEPVLSSFEASSPGSQAVTLASAGSTVFSATFTVAGAMGHITGSVSSGGAPIKTGVLIVVTTSLLTGSPPAVPNFSTATLSGAPFFVTSSGEDGNYSLDVSQSTAPKYNVYAYYPKPSGGSATMAVSAVANVSVLAGQTAAGVNFSW
jgi:prepilin-type N-terminal cleavage/methylation domain-containing protein